MQHHPSVYWRRRAIAIGVAALVVGLPLAALTSGGDERDRTAAPAATRAQTAPPALPRGGGTIFPAFRVVAFYGAPQDDELGALGIRTPEAAARRLERQAARYARRTRPVLPAMELIATVAAGHPGADGLYRLQQDRAVIDRYLRAARRHKMLLLLDIQPGHADFMDEVERLEPWLRQPDVGLALDPEWSTPGARPGTVIGSVTAEKVNEVSAWLAGLVRRERLPEKLLVIHQFTEDMVVGKESVVRRPGLAVTFNVDGFGDRPNKLSKYRAFTSEAVRFHDGLKLFYREDTNLMTPRYVLALRPAPDLVVYE